MEKTLFEQMGGTYTKVGDYYLPALALPAEKEKHIGVWGQRHAKYANWQGVTEQLKSQNQFLWIQKMSNILACVREVVENEIIYS